MIATEVHLRQTALGVYIRRAVVCRPDVGVCVHLSIYLSLSLSLLHPPLSAPDTPPLGHQALCTARARRGSSCPCLSHVMRRAIVCTHATCLSSRRAGAGSHRPCVCLCSSRKRRPRTPSPSRRRHRGTHARPRAATPCPARPRAVIAACSRGFCGATVLYGTYGTSEASTLPRTYSAWRLGASCPGTQEAGTRSPYVLYGVSGAAYLSA